MMKNCQLLTVVIAIQRRIKERTLNSRHTDFKKKAITIYSVRSVMTVQREEFCYDLVECHLILPRF